MPGLAAQELQLTMLDSRLHSFRNARPKAGLANVGRNSHARNQRGQERRAAQATSCQAQ